MRYILSNNLVLISLLINLGTIINLYASCEHCGRQTCPGPISIYPAKAMQEIITTVEKGRLFQVELPVDRAEGQRWKVHLMPKSIELVDDKFVKSTKPGEPDKHILIFKAKWPATVTLRLHKIIEKAKEFIGKEKTEQVIREIKRRVRKALEKKQIKIKIIDAGKFTSSHY